MGLKLNVDYLWRSECCICHKFQGACAEIVYAAPNLVRSARVWQFERRARNVIWKWLQYTIYVTRNMRFACFHGSRVFARCPSCAKCRFMLCLYDRAFKLCWRRQCIYIYSICFAIVMSRASYKNIIIQYRTLCIGGIYSTGCPISWRYVDDMLLIEDVIPVQ